MTSRRPVRILHVIGSLTRGGIETWLMHVLRSIDRERYHIDFLVHTTAPRAYDAEARALGSKILPCLHPSNPVRYARSFRAIIRQQAPYDIVHGNVHHFDGFLLRLAHQARIPARIAHSHNDTTSVQAGAGYARQGYYGLMRHLIRKHATHGLAASEKAAVSLFGLDWKHDPRWSILHYGVDLAPFKQSVNAAAVRAELGLPPDSVVLGHVGRFVHQKNHEFLIEIMQEVVRREPRAYLLLVGDGDLRPDIATKVERLGLSQRVVFAGPRDDVPRLMLGAMDVFVLPSWFEGLPLVGIEAQAAGLPCILSNEITQELDAIEPLIRRLPLSEPPSSWASVIMASWTSGRMPAAEAVSCLRGSSFDIQAGVRRLEEIYVSIGRAAATSSAAAGGSWI